MYIYYCLVLHYAVYQSILYKYPPKFQIPSPLLSPPPRFPHAHPSSTPWSIPSSSFSFYGPSSYRSDSLIRAPDPDLRSTSLSSPFSSPVACPPSCPRIRTSKPEFWTRHPHTSQSYSLLPEDNTTSSYTLILNTWYFIPHILRLHPLIITAFTFHFHSPSNKIISTAPPARHP